MTKRILLVGVESSGLTPASGALLKQQVEERMAGVIDEVVIIGGMVYATVVESGHTPDFSHCDCDYHVATFCEGKP